MFPELATERLLLQPILPEDQPFIFEGLSHPQVIPYYGVQYKTLEETALQMLYYNQIWQQQSGAWWKIVTKDTLEKAGAIGYNNYSVQNNKCEVGYWLLPKYWGNGLISEALQKMITYLFQKKGVHRIEALIEEGNQPSCSVAVRNGFKQEGLLRDYEWKNERYISLHIYSLLASDKR
jgi:[ribosomal protein S5]-alanine N-acetyltransferase